MRVCRQLGRTNSLIGQFEGEVTRVDLTVSGEVLKLKFTPICFYFVPQNLPFIDSRHVLCDNTKGMIHGVLRLSIARREAAQKVGLDCYSRSSVVYLELNSAADPNARNRKNPATLPHWSE